MGNKYFFDKIDAGLKLAFRKMLKEKANNNEEIVVSENDKIVHLKAKDVLEKLKLKGGL